MRLDLVGQLAFMGLALWMAVAAVGGLAAWLGGRGSLARAILRASAALVVAYVVALLGVSMSSRERVIPRGEELPVCGLDCDLFFSVAGAERAASPTGESANAVRWRVTVRARSDARRVTMNLGDYRVELVDAAGGLWHPLATGPGRVPPLFDSPLGPGELQDRECVFLLPADVRTARLHVVSSPGIARFVIADEGSLMHARTLLALDPEDRVAARR